MEYLHILFTAGAFISLLYGATVAVSGDTGEACFTGLLLVFMSLLVIYQYLPITLGWALSLGL